MRDNEITKNLPPTKPLVLPDDTYNRALVENVHPTKWINPTPSGRYNLVVVGGGTAGLICAAGAAGMGAKVALIEKHLLGGDCLNFGCVPSKALISAGRAQHAAGTISKSAFTSAMLRMRRLRSEISAHDSAQRFTDLGVDVYLGAATFSAKNKVTVCDQPLEFSRAVIATGARARIPAINGLAECGFSTNESVFSLTELPQRFLVIGAGPIGCELAQALSRLGSQVTIIGRNDQLMPREDSEAGSLLASQFEQENIKVIVAANIHSVRRTGSASEKAVICEIEGQRHELLVDEILVSVGRVPNTEGMGLDAAGVEFDETGIQVNDQLRSTNKRVFAAGDVCSKYKFTHAADAMARIVIQNALFLGRKKASSLKIPWCTFTDPEVAHIGLTQQEATSRGAVTLTVQLSDLDRAVLDGQEKGFARIHLAPKDGQILGATMVASHAGELISEISLAMTAGLSIDAIAQTIHPYPTLSEVWKRLGDQWSRRRLTPRISRMSRTWLSWRR